MSLVHRSWTLPAQRALAYWRYFDTAYTIPLHHNRDNFCNPTFGPGSKRLDIWIDRPQPRESLRLLAQTFGQFTNIHSLVFSYLQFKKAEISPGHELLKQIPAMTSLEVLEVCTRRARSLALQAYNIIPQLLYLREFHLMYDCDEETDQLETMQAPAVTDALHQLQSLVPPKYLESVSIVDCIDMGVTIPILGRLVAPREGHIKLFCWNIGYSAGSHKEDSEPWTQQIFNVLAPALPYLTSLEIYTTFASEGPNVDRDSELFRMIKRECISLRQLSVCESKSSKRFPRYIRDVLEAETMAFEFRRCTAEGEWGHMYGRHKWQDDTIY